MKKISSTFFCFLLLALPSLLQAGEIEVPADYKSIQKAIDAAKAHDVILVSHGVYHERNRLEANKTAGIGISQQSKAYIADNKCLENKLVAIGVRDGSDVVLKENVLIRTGGMPPIVAILDGSQAIALDNQIEGGGVAGVLLQGNLIAARNQLEGQNGGSGISIGKGSHATIKNNNIAGYKRSINDQR